MDPVTKWSAEQQRWAEAPRILGESLHALSLPREVDIAALVRRAEESSDVARNANPRGLAALLAQLPERTWIAAAAYWLTTDCVYLHLLIPEILRAAAAPSAAVAEQVLDWGVAYADPSLNRPFIEAAVERVGRERAVQLLLNRTDGLASAYYWLPNGAVTAPERLLRKRLRPFASYLRKWWSLF